MMRRMILAVSVSSLLLPPVWAAPTTAPAHFQLAGEVVDEAGQPIADVRVAATNQSAGGSVGYIGVTETDSAGHFAIDRTRALSGMSIEDVGTMSQRLAFDQPHFVHEMLEDLRLLPADSLTHLHIVLNRGKHFTVTVTDEAGRPLRDALAVASFGPESWDYERRASSDASGQFTLEGLPGRPDVRVVAAGAGDTLLSGELREVPASAGPTTEPTAIVLRPLQIAADHVHHVLGMTLADIDAGTAKQLGCGDSPGVLVLDLGTNPQRFNIGDFRRGDLFWMVGNQRVDSVQAFIDQLAAVHSKAVDFNQRTPTGVRVVYNFILLDGSGSNTQYIHLTDADLAELNRLRSSKL